MASADEHADPGRAARLVDEALRLTWIDPRRGLEIAVAAAAVAETAPDTRWCRARALLAAARCAATTSDWAACARLAEEGLRAIDGTEGVAEDGCRSQLLSTRADAAVRQGDLTLAQALAAEALELGERHDDREAAAHALWALGNTAFFLGDHAISRRLFEVGRELFAGLGHELGTALMTGNIGEALVRRGELREGIAAIMESLERLRGLAPIAVPRALVMLAEARLATAQPEAALELLDDALAETVAQRRSDMEGLAYAWRGWALAAMGRHRDARAAFELALGLARDCSFREAELEALLGLGTTDTRLGALDRAAEQLEAAGALASTSRQRSVLGRAHRLLADVHESQGAIERAYGHLRASLAVTELPPHEVVVGRGVPAPEDIVARWWPEPEPDVGTARA